MSYGYNYNSRYNNPSYNANNYNRNAQNASAVSGQAMQSASTAGLLPNPMYPSIMQQLFGTGPELVPNYASAPQANAVRPQTPIQYYTHPIPPPLPPTAPPSKPPLPVAPPPKQSAAPPLPPQLSTATTNKASTQSAQNTASNSSSIASLFGNPFGVQPVTSTSQTQTAGYNAVSSNQSYNPAQSYQVYNNWWQQQLQSQQAAQPPPPPSQSLDPQKKIIAAAPVLYGTQTATAQQQTTWLQNLQTSAQQYAAKNITTKQPLLSQPIATNIAVASSNPTYYSHIQSSQAQTTKGYNNSAITGYNNIRSQSSNYQSNYRGSQPPRDDDPKRDKIVARFKNDDLIETFNDKTRETAFYCGYCNVYIKKYNKLEKHVNMDGHRKNKALPFMETLTRGFNKKFLLNFKKTLVLNQDDMYKFRIEFNRIPIELKHYYCRTGVRANKCFGDEAFFCKRCRIWLPSISAVEQHIATITHRLRDNRLTLMNLINQNKDRPLVGLSFLVEYNDPNEPEEYSYECKLCNVIADSYEMYPHIYSYAHRIKLLAYYSPFTATKYVDETPRTCVLLENEIRDLMKTHALGCMEKKREAPPDKRQDRSPSVEIIDDSNDDKTNDDKKAKPEEKLKSVEQTTHETQKTKLSLKEQTLMDLAKPKPLDREKSSLEKAFAVRVTSESDADDVTHVIKMLTDSVMEYHLSKFPADQREKLRQQLKECEKLIN